MLNSFLRWRLLAACDRHQAALRWRDDGYDGSTDQIREGVSAARRIIREVPLQGSPWRYLEAVRSALLGEMGRLDSLAGSEDDQTTAGIATIRSEAQGLGRALAAWIVIAGVLAVAVCLLLRRFWS
jgi:hypothetical protein